MIPLKKNHPRTELMKQKYESARKNDPASASTQTHDTFKCDKNPYASTFRVKVGKPIHSNVFYERIIWIINEIIPKE